MDALVNRIITAFAILSALFVLSVGAMYYGYFLISGAAFMPFFSFSNFTSQTVVLLPVIAFVGVFVVIIVQYVYQFFERDAASTRRWLNRVVVGAFAIMLGLVTLKAEFPNALGVNILDLLTATSVIALLFTIHAFYEEVIIASPSPIVFAVSILLIFASFEATLVAAGAQWARYDMLQPPNYCITAEKESFPATILKASSGGILFKRPGHDPEFRSTGAVKVVGTKDGDPCRHKS